MVAHQPWRTKRLIADNPCRNSGCEKMRGIDRQQIQEVRPVLYYSVFDLFCDHSSKKGRICGSKLDPFVIDRTTQKIYRIYDDNLFVERMMRHHRDHTKPS